MISEKELDKIVKYLKEKYKFSSTGETQYIYELIEYYEKTKYLAKNYAIFEK